MEKTKRNLYWPDTKELTKPAREVAKILGVHPNTVFRWVKSGKIECLRYSKNSIYFTFDQINDFINSHRMKVLLKI